MAIMQNQRPAIEESLVGKEPEELPSALASACLVLEDGPEVYLLGVSQGEDLHSKMQGVHVLVVGCSQPELNPCISEGAITKCNYVVLLRRALPEEYGGHPPEANLFCVELLTVKVGLAKGGRIVLFRTGEKSIYLSTIVG